MIARSARLDTGSVLLNDVNFITHKNNINSLAFIFQLFANLSRYFLLLLFNFCLLMNHGCKHWAPVLTQNLLGSNARNCLSGLVNVNTSLKPQRFFPSPAYWAPQQQKRQAKQKYMLCLGAHRCRRRSGNGTRVKVERTRLDSPIHLLMASAWEFHDAVATDWVSFPPE